MTAVDDGVRVTSAVAGRLRVTELEFPPLYRLGWYEPEHPYMALVLQGGLEKSFARRHETLGHASVVTMPGGAAHATDFGRTGARVLIVMPSGPVSSFPANALGELRHLRDAGLTGLAGRLAAELRAVDTAAALAVEGLALELVAATARGATAQAAGRRPPPWLATVDELLHARLFQPLGLAEVACAVGVHPAHLARVFRERHGISVGAYLRRLRLDWAAVQLAREDISLAALAAQAGFADQSHFTRAFKRHTGVTPGRYRHAVAGGRQDAG
ncbi:MAG: helix-turn-helix transcriptional regulator, partial [Gaiellaceae bacterium]